MGPSLVEVDVDIVGVDPSIAEYRSSTQDHNNIWKVDVDIIQQKEEEERITNKHNKNMWINLKSTSTGHASFTMRKKIKQI